MSALDVLSNQTDESQNARLAELLGTAPEKLCPGLQNTKILEFLDPYHPNHRVYMAEIAEYINSKDVRNCHPNLKHLTNNAGITAEEVADLWLKFATGIQYGYEQGPIRDVPARPELVVGFATVSEFFAVYHPEINQLGLGRTSFFALAVMKGARKLAKENDPIAIDFLKNNPVPEESEFLGIEVGLEEIRHSDQYNNAELRAKMEREKAEAYPEGRPDFRGLPLREANPLREKDPEEIDAAKFYKQHLQGAIARYQQTIAKLQPKPDPLASLFFQIDAGASLGTLHSNDPNKKTKGK